MRIISPSSSEPYGSSRKTSLRIFEIWILLALATRRPSPQCIVHAALVIGDTRPSTNGMLMSFAQRQITDSRLGSSRKRQRLIMVTALIRTKKATT